MKTENKGVCYTNCLNDWAGLDWVGSNSSVRSAWMKYKECRKEQHSCGPLNVPLTVSILDLLFSTKLGLLAAGVHCLKGTRDVHIFYMCSQCVVPSAVLAPICGVHFYQSAILMSGKPLWGAQLPQSGVLNIFFPSCQQAGRKHGRQYGKALSKLYGLKSKEQLTWKPSNFVTQC